MRWYPIITFWQVSADLTNAGGVPGGHGHNYGYSVLDGWVAVATLVATLAAGIVVGILVGITLSLLALIAFLGGCSWLLVRALRRRRLEFRPAEASA